MSEKGAQMLQALLTEILVAGETQSYRQAGATLHDPARVCLIPLLTPTLIPPLTILVQPMRRRSCQFLRGQEREALSGELRTSTCRGSSGTYGGSESTIVRYRRDFLGQAKPARIDIANDSSSTAMVRRRTC